MDSVTTPARTAELAVQTARTSGTGVPGVGQASTPEQALAIGKKFEAMFMTEMLNHMSAGIEADKSYFGGGHGESMFRPMLNEEYGKIIANRGNGIGLAQQVAKMLLSHQEV